MFGLHTKYNFNARFAAGVAVAVLGLAVAGFAWLQGQPGGSSPTVVHESVSLTHSLPPDVTDEQILAFHLALVNDEPLPPGFQETGRLGKIKGVLTGVQTLEPPEQMLSVTLTDDIADLNEAWLYLDSQLLFHATRQNGSIVDRGDQGIAMLNGFIPIHGDFTVRLEWDGASGHFVAQDAIAGL